MNAVLRRRSALRPVLLVAGGVAVLAVAFWVVLASALNPDRLKGELQDAVLRATGRTLAVNGGVHLRIGLSPQFEADDIALANMEGGSRPNMLTASSLRAQLALLPLLSGDAVISALTVQNGDLLLEHGADGTPNWHFTAPHHALYQGHGGGAGSGGHHVEIRRFALEGGSLTWQPQNGGAQTFGIQSASLVADSDDAPVSLSFDGAYQGKSGPVPFTLTGTSGSLQRLNGGPVSALAGPWPVALKIASQGADLGIDGGVNHPEQARGYQFRLKFHAADLSALNGFFSKPVLPPLQDVTASGVLADGSQGELVTSQFSARAAQSDLSALAPGLMIRQALFSAPGPGQLAQVSVDGSYADQPLRLAAAVMQPDVFSSTAPLQLTLSAAAAGATLSAHGTLPPRLDSAGLDVQLEAKAADLSSLSPLLKMNLPAAHDVAASAELEDAGVKLRGVVVRNLMLASSLGDAAGEMTVNWTPRASVTGTLASRMIDLDALVSGSAGQTLPLVWPPPQNSAPPVQPDPQPVPQTASMARAPAQGAPISLPAMPALPLAFLRDHDADFAITVADLAAWGEHYHDVAAHLRLADGKLAVNPFRAEAPEGALIGGASIDASTDDPPIAVTLRSPAISAGALASLLGHPGEAKGTMQVDAQLSGVGQTALALEASLNGHVGLALVGGEVSDSLVQALIGDALQTAGVPGLGGGESQVRCFALRTDFANGTGTVRTLALDTSRLSLSGDGVVDLRARTADLHLRPQIRLGPTEVAAPVSLQGQFGDLKASLDPVMGGGRVGIQIGGSAGSGCLEKLALARNGLGGPVPQVAAAPPVDPGFAIKIKKPKDLLQGLFH